LHALGSVPWVTLAGQVIVGAVISLTVTVNVQVPVLGGTAASDAEQLTVVTPLLKVEPLAGLQVTVREPSQLSVAVGCV
jgi:negative regulator of sigma E activity